LQQGAVVGGGEGYTSKHKISIRQRTDVPAAEVLIKGAGIREHQGHIGHTGGIPPADGLVENAGASKHIPHPGHLAGVPTADILVEDRIACEHTAHIGYIALWGGSRCCRKLCCQFDHAAEPGLRLFPTALEDG